MPYWLQEEADRYLRDRRNVAFDVIKVEPFAPEKEEEKQQPHKSKRSFWDFLKRLILRKRGDNR